MVWGPKGWRLFLAILAVFLFPGREALAANIYLMPGGDEYQTKVMITLLEGAGHKVTEGVQYFKFDGSVDLGSYHLVVLLNSSNWDSGDMPEKGQTQLVDFVTSGHGLITGEWVLWNWSKEGKFKWLYEVLPATSDGTRSETSPIVYKQDKPDPILNAGLPESFKFEVTNYKGTEGNIKPKDEAWSFYVSSKPACGLVGWQIKEGRVLSFSTPIGPDELGDENYSKLFLNAVTWTTVPLPGSLLLLGSGLVSLLGLRRLLR